MSHTNLLYHLVFATKDRIGSISPAWESRLHGYLGGIIKGQSGIPIEINGIEDHLHALVRLSPKRAVADVLRELKSDSSAFVKKEFDRSFGWQKRYGAFSVSESNVEAVRRYIRNQKEHHKRIGFTDEYKRLLALNSVDFDERYLWN
jgi:putative transposase